MGRRSRDGRAEAHRPPLSTGRRHWHKRGTAAIRFRLAQQARQPEGPRDDREQAEEEQRVEAEEAEAPVFDAGDEELMWVRVRKQRPLTYEDRDVLDAIVMSWLKQSKPLVPMPAGAADEWDGDLDSG